MNRHEHIRECLIILNRLYPKQRTAHKEKQPVNEFRFNDGSRIDKAEFISKHKNDVIGYLYVVQNIKDLEQREDIFGDMCVKVYECVDSFNDENHAIRYYTKWCRGILRNKMWEQGKYEYQYDYQTPVDESEPDDTLIDLVKEKIILLPKKQQRYVRMCFIEGVSQKEVAETCEVTISAVNRSIKLGLNTIRKSCGFNEMDSGITRQYRRSVEMYSLDGEYIETYLSISDAHRNTGISIGGIGASCQGLVNMAGGYDWRYSPVIN